MATLDDVAREVGVSSSTASRALNRPAMVRPDIVARVRATADSLGYVPNAFARSLRVQSSRTLGLLVPLMVNEFVAEVARQIEQSGFRAGYSVVVGDADRSADREAERARLLHSQRVDGVVIIPTDSHSTGAIDWLRARGMPVVIVERRLPEAAADSVVSDAAAGVQLAVAHLIERGHRQIGCLAGGSHLPNHVERLAAFRAALDDAGLAGDPSAIVTGIMDYADGTAATQALLGRPNPPTALVCTNDRLAIGAIRGAALHGRRVPDDLAVVGYGDIAVAAHVQPPLTSIAPDKAAVGALAVDVLLRRIAQRSSTRQSRPQRYVVPVGLSVRESTGGPAVSTTADSPRS